MRLFATIRGRLLGVIVALVGAALVATILSFNALFAWQLNKDAASVVRQLAAQERAAVQVVDGQLVVPPPTGVTIEARAWIFAGDRTVGGPRADPQLQEAAEQLVREDGRSTRVSAPATLLHALPIMADGQRVGTVVAGVSLAPYERVLERVRLLSLVIGLVILLTATVVAHIFLRAAFQPVTRMTRAAAAWSDRDLDRRFALGPPGDEITELAWTLDGLLDRVAASVRRERRLTAEISHELRTPLAQVRAEADLALRRPRSPREYQEALQAITAGAERMGGTIETLLASARARSDGGRGVAAIDEVVDEAVQACAHLAAARGIRVERGAPAPGILIGVDRDHAVRTVLPLLENACRYTAGQITIAVRRAGSLVTVRITDDGPGVAQGEQGAIFEPGRQGAAGEASGGGGGLGLALAQRLAHSIGGDVVAIPGPGGRFEVRFPAG